MASGRRWTILAFSALWIGDTLDFACVTDVPCHITLRWTEKETILHLREQYERGLRIPKYPKYCFVQYQEVEQPQAGDTQYHTFVIPDWHECLTRWFYFVATIDALTTRSTSAIFVAHAFDEIWGMTVRHTELLDKEVAGIIDHADSSITKAKLTFPILLDSFSVRQSGGQDIPTGIETLVDWDGAPEWDQLSGYLPGSSSFSIPSTGKYLVTIQVSFVSFLFDEAVRLALKNNGAIISRSYAQSVVTGLILCAQLSTLISATTGDTLTVTLLHGTGLLQTTHWEDSLNQWTITKISE